MLTTTASLALGLAFLILGGVNVWLVLEAWSRVKAAKVSSRMLALHRMGGYLFIALFCVITISCWPACVAARRTPPQR